MAGSGGGAALFIIIIIFCVVLVLVKLSHKLRTHADANSSHRRVEGAHDANEPENDIAMQDNLSYIGTPEDESKHIHTESSLHTTQGAVDSARIVGFATTEEKGVSDDMDDVKVNPNPAYDTLSGAVKLEDNPSYNTIKYISYK